MMQIGYVRMGVTHGFMVMLMAVPPIVILKILVIFVMIVMVMMIIVVVMGMIVGDALVRVLVEVTRCDCHCHTHYGECSGYQLVSCQRVAENRPGGDGPDERSGRKDHLSPGGAELVGALDPQHDGRAITGRTDHEGSQHLAQAEPEIANETANETAAAAARVAEQEADTEIG